MMKAFLSLFAAALIGCSSTPPPGPQVALRGQGSKLDHPAGVTHCECDFTCAATGRLFVGLSALSAQQACAKGNSLCTQSGCTSCVQSGPASCE
jgi:hypothetical protein